MVHRLWPLGMEWFDEQLAAIEAGKPPSGNQPRSYPWETDGPPSSDPATRATHFARTLAAGFWRDPASAVNELRLQSHPLATS